MEFKEYKIEHLKDPKVKKRYNQIKKKKKKIQITFSFSPADYDMLISICIEQGITEKKAIKNLVRSYLETQHKAHYELIFGSSEG